MPPEVNIHVKAPGAQQSTTELNQVAKGVEEVGVKADRAGNFLRDAFSKFVIPLDPFQAFDRIVSGIRKIISAIEEWKRASADAVKEMASTQRTAGSLFEAMGAYSFKDRNAVLAQARGVQATTGLPFESSMQLLEAQKRSFGEVNPQSTEQFAAYWQLHTGSQTPDLVHWMSESGIKTPDRQGQIMRMISAVADQSKLKEEDIIGAISSRAERFRAMGWSPEQTITNIGKALGGLSPTESSKAMRGMFEGLEGFDESKAREMRAPPQVAASEQGRLEWLKNKTANLPVEQRNVLLRQAFGNSYPYIAKMFEQTSPELQQAIDYAASPQAAAETRHQFEEFKKTPEGVMGKAGAAEGLRTEFSSGDLAKTAIREYGKNYLDYLRIHEPLKYQLYSAFPVETAYEKAARDLWQQAQPSVMQTTTPLVPNGMGGFTSMPPVTIPVKPGWEGVPEEEKIQGLETARTTITHFHNEQITNYYPSTGDDNLKGPRADRTLK